MTYLFGFNIITSSKFYNFDMLNVTKITEETKTRKQALQTIDNRDQKMVMPGVQERIVEALITTKSYQAKRMGNDSLNVYLIRVCYLYGMNSEDAKILLENISQKNPEDLKVIYAELIKNAQREVYTVWTIFSVFSLAMITMNIAYSPAFLILMIFDCFILPILYAPDRAGTFLINEKKVKKIAGPDYCPLELIKYKQENSDLEG